jgi:hypothetical protein
MTIDGGPEPPEDGYPDPGKYTPDNLGEKKVWESNGRLSVILPPSAIDHLGAEDEDMIVFTEDGDGEVHAEVKADD